MKRIIPFFTLALLISISAQAQTFVQVGTGTERSTYPMHSSWDYAWSTYMYTAEELGNEAVIIDKIAYYAATNMGGWGFSFTDQEIYLKMTTDQSVSTLYPDLTTYTKVFTGDIEYPTDGEDWIIIDVEDFEYDGSSNLLVHYQNHRGESLSSIYLIQETNLGDDYSKGVLCGSDVSFPSGNTAYVTNIRPNTRFYSPAGECDAVISSLVYPKTGAIKVPVDSSIVFSMQNADKYDFYFGTNPNNLQKVAENVTVSEDGDCKYVPAEKLLSKMKYYCKIVSYRCEDVAESPIYSFRTEKFTKISDATSFECDFEDYYIGGITGAKISNIINTNYPDSSDWSYDNGWNCEESDQVYQGSFSAKCNKFFSSGEASLYTPRLELPANSKMSFFWKNDENTTSGFVTTYVEITTDGGQNWTILRALTPEEAMDVYKYEVIDLSDYVSDDVKLRWRHDQPNSLKYNAFWLDNLEVSLAVEGPDALVSESDYAFEELSVGGEQFLSLNIKNVGRGDLVISEPCQSGPFSCDYTGTIAPGEDVDVTVAYRPMAEGTFSNTLNFVSNIEGSFGIELTGNSYQPFAEVSETFDGGSYLPDYWMTLNSPTDAYCKAEVEYTTTDAYSGTYAARLIKINDLDFPASLIMPGVKYLGNGDLEFYAKCSAGNAGLELQVVLMKNPTDPDTYEVIKTIALTEYYNKHIVRFSDDAVGPYIAFRNSSNTASASIWLDDIVYYATDDDLPKPAVIDSPSNEDTNVGIENIELSWTDGGRTTGYKLNVGTDYPPTNIVQNLEVDMETASYSFTETLAYETVYYWQVVPYNDKGDCDQASIWSFTTMEDPVIPVPGSPSLLSPADDAQNINTFMKPVLKWMAGTGETSGYKLSLGTDNPPTNVLSEIDLTNESYITDVDLAYDTKYYWQVVPYNDGGDCEDLKVWSFTTIADPTVTQLPYTEDFESVVLSNGSYGLPNGWSVEDTHNDGNGWNLLETANMVQDTKGMYAQADATNDKDDYLFSAPIQLESGQKYVATFKLHTVENPATNSFSTEDIELFIGSGNTAADMDATPIASESVQNDIWKDVAAGFEVSANGSYFLGFHATSAADGYYLIIDDVTVTNVTDINNREILELIKLYPNPAEDVINIEAESLNGSVIKIISQTGQLIKVVSIENSRQALDVASLPSGIYNLIVVTESGIASKPFIKK